MQGSLQMPKLVVTHEVNNVAHWLASPRREEVFSGVAKNICTFVDPTDASEVALTMDVPDMGAFDAVLQSAAGADAMQYDGVRPETVKIYVQG